MYPLSDLPRGELVGGLSFLTPVENVAVFCAAK